MSHKLKIIVLALLAIALVGAVGLEVYLYKQVQSVPMGAAFSLEEFGRVATSGRATLDTTSRLVLATTTNRQYAYLCNESTLEQAYLGLGITAVAGEGVMLGESDTAHACYEISARKNLFTGAINAIASTSEVTLSIVER